jgi:hypothetical protein
MPERRGLAVAVAVALRVAIAVSAPVARGLRAVARSVAGADFLA